MVEPGGGPTTGRVLAIHPGALGDVVQAVPALRALRALPGVAGVDFAGQPRLGRLLVGLEAAAEALDFDGLGLEALFVADAELIRARRRLAPYDRVVSWFGARAEPYPARLREVVAEALVASPVTDEGSPLPVWQHLLSSLSPWQVPDRAPEPLRPPEDWLARARAELARPGAGGPLIVVHPGAGGRGKRWPAARFREAIAGACRDVPCRVVVHEGPADAEAAEEVLVALETARLAARPVRLLRPDLELLAGVLASCAAYLGADSGISQLAAAVGAPAVIVYPATTASRWAPWSPTARALTMTGDGRDAAAAAAALRALVGTRPGEYTGPGPRPIGG